MLRDLFYSQVSFHEYCRGRFRLDCASRGTLAFLLVVSTFRAFRLFFFTRAYTADLDSRNAIGGGGAMEHRGPRIFFVHQRVIMTLQKIVISRLLSRDRVTSTDPFSVVPINQPRVVRYETKREQPSPRSTKVTGNFEGLVLGRIKRTLRVAE